MSRWMSVITGLLLLGLGATSVYAMHEPVENCDNSGWTAAKIVTTTSSHVTTLDFVGSGGAFDPTPLLETSVKTNGRGCIIATLSAFALPRDNWTLFQVLVNGEPTYGHMSSDEFFTQMGDYESAA